MSAVPVDVCLDRITKLEREKRVLIRVLTDHAKRLRLLERAAVHGSNGDQDP